MALDATRVFAVQRCAAEARRQRGRAIRAEFAGGGNAGIGGAGQRVLYQGIHRAGFAQIAGRAGANRGVLDRARIWATTSGERCPRRA